MSLIKACIQPAGHGLNQVDLVRLATHLGLPCEANSDYHDLLRAIALHVSDNDTEFAELVMKMDKTTQKTVNELIEDPFFELAFDMMNDDDKGEHPEVGEALHKKRAKHREAHDREERKRQKMARGSGTPRQPAASPGRPAAGSGSPAPTGGPATPAPGPEPILAPAQENPAAEAEAAPKAKAKPKAKAVAVQRLPRGAAGMPWGNDFVIAETTRYGEVAAVTVTCLCHTADGKRCNKWVSVGPGMDIASAEHRIKEWCIRGYDIDDEPGGCAEHMKPRPRYWPDSELRPLETLERLCAQGRPRPTPAPLSGRAQQTLFLCSIAGIACSAHGYECLHPETLKNHYPLS